MANYQKVKGTQDFYGIRSNKINYIEQKVKETIKNFGYNQIITPVFENTEVFEKNVGDESDVVKKEMYTFLDKGNRSITLRPEGTSAVARCFIENKMYASCNGNNLIKFFYIEPMFRYERPGTGRYREFRQFGVEVFGKGSPLLDCDVILSSYAVFKSLGIKNITLKINSIGNIESRNNYSKALKEYFRPKINCMCADCVRRLETNPMRILDCKVDNKTLDNNNVSIIENAPKINEYLTEESKKYFSEVLEGLEAFNIPYVVDYNLVRGLDYYTDTVFEFIIQSDDEYNGLAIGGGGKYADMIKSMCNIDVEGIGYGFGIERIMAVMDSQNLWKDIESYTDVVIIGLDYESKIEAIKLASSLRSKNKVVEMDYINTSMKQQFKLCDKLNPKFIIIIGENERKSGLFTIKNTVTKTQENVKKENINEYIESTGK